MKYRIEIECDNDAFLNPDGVLDPCAEVASILRHLCRDHLELGYEHGTSLFDTNGNRVGFAEFVS